MCPGGWCRAGESRGAGEGGRPAWGSPAFAVFQPLNLQGISDARVSASHGTVAAAGGRSREPTRPGFSSLRPTPLPHSGSRGGPRCSHVLAPTTRASIGQSLPERARRRARRVLWLRRSWSARGLPPGSRSPSSPSRWWGQIGDYNSRWAGLRVHAQRAF